MNNDKTEFRNIASKLEELLREYKNTFPKNFGQILNLDIPFYALGAAAVVIFNVIPIYIYNYALFCIFILSIPLLYSRYKGSEIRKIVDERRHYSEIQSNLRVKIRKLKADRYSKYPDVKIYLKKYHNELKEVERHKQKILDLYHLFVTGIIALLICGIVFIYQHNNKKNSAIVYRQQSSEKYIATIKPLATTNNFYMKKIGTDNIIIKYNEKKSVLSTEFKELKVAGYPQLRVMITDTLGHPISGIPIFYYKIDGKSYAYVSASLVDKAENSEYEKKRRLDYLNKYGNNFRYVIEGLD